MPKKENVKKENVKKENDELKKVITLLTAALVVTNNNKNRQ